MALIGASNEMDATKQDLIIDLVQKELQFRAFLLPLVRNVSQYAVKGTQSISFPKLGSFTAEERAAGAAFTEQVVASSVDKLDLDKRVGIHYIIDPDEAVESTLAWELEMAQRAASGKARKIDSDILTVFESAGQATTTAGNITYDIILEMRELLLNAEAEIDNRGALVVSVDQEKELLKIDEFRRQDIYGANSAIRLGQLGTIFGMPVYRHTGLGAQKFYMMDTDAVAFGFQKQPRMGEQPAVEYGADARKVTLNCKYGLKGLQLGEGPTAGPTESAWIIKDNNV